MEVRRQSRGSLLLYWYTSMIFMADRLAALHDTAETKFATDLKLKIEQTIYDRTSGIVGWIIPESRNNIF